jgi:hypothetical protein
MLLLHPKTITVSKQGSYYTFKSGQFAHKAAFIFKDDFKFWMIFTLFISTGIKNIMQFFI